MKIRIPGQAMRFTVLIAVFCLLIMEISFGQDCITQAANKPSTFARTQDNYWDMSNYTRKPAKWNISKMQLQLGKTENWIKNILTGFKGAKLTYSNDYTLDFVVTEDPLATSHAEMFYRATGIKGYYEGKLRFFAYYCYDNSNTIHTEAESGSFVKIVFNNVLASDLKVGQGLQTVNGKYTFEILEKDRSEGRIDFYDLRNRTDFSDTIKTSKREIIVIRNSDKPVFIPVTRKEYMEQMLKDIDASYAKSKDFMTSNYKNQLKAFEAEMKAYKSDRLYTPEKEAKRRKWFEEDNNPAKTDKALKKLDDEIKGSKDVINQYLRKPKEWLSRGVSSLFMTEYSAAAVNSYLEGLDTYKESKEDYRRTQVVYINPAYFDKAQSRDLPQAILVEIAKGRYDHMVKAAALIKKPGALDPLYAIVNPGRQLASEVIQPEMTSTYTLQYLSKLKTLTPLTVPAGVKLSINPVANIGNTNIPPARSNFAVPALSPKLSQLPQALTAESYKTYIQQLYTAIAGSIKPDEKQKADNYLKNKKQSLSKDISKTAFAAWLQNTPRASLYFYSKAVTADPSDALAANNFSAFLMMGGLAEKSIPILEYWNKQKPGQAIILSNLGNAYFRLGDIDKAMKYLQQCVEYDTLNPAANKILSIIYLKKGDAKKAEEHAKRSITKSHDEQVIALLRNLNTKAKPGEIMSHLPAKEFPLLKRIKLPILPSGLDDMEQFEIEWGAAKASLEITIAAIEEKMPRVNEEGKQQILMASLKSGISPLRAKAQYIIMDGLQTYQRERVRENDVFKYYLQKPAADFSTKVKAINKKYSEKLNKLEGGEAGDEDEISELELAKCKELNAEKAKYLGIVSPIVNQYAQRQEFISRKFYRDYANWAPYWMPVTTVSFPSIEKDYLKDVLGILSEYIIISKTNCPVMDPLEKKEGKLQIWEDEYCANFKGKIALGAVAITWTCNSWGVEGGEGIVGELEVNYTDDGEFDGFTIGGGLGESLEIAGIGTTEVEAGMSIKEFIKIGRDKGTGKWEVQDFGFKGDATVEANIGPVAAEIKIIEVSMAVNAGFNADGLVIPLLKL
jgi:tetratricopeptide (TPR) repeat protein